MSAKPAPHKPTEPAPRYLVHTGLTWPASPADVALRRAGKPCEMKYAEPGEVRDDLHPSSIAWLLERKHITLVEQEAPSG